MACYRYLTLLLILIGTSCAQVGTITGGADDVTAPQPVVDDINPKNESVNFSVNQVVIPFNEFIRLKDPAQNIKIVPPHVVIKSSLKGKELTLSWDEQLQENTTYAIYLNNAVQDITESNDTLIQYVFSTGSSIDSLSYSVRIVDAENNTPINKCVVTLVDEATNELQSFAESDNNGIAVLRYLPAKSFKMTAFLDENGDLELQKHEKRGFNGNQIIDVNTSIVDSIPIRLFQPILPSEIRTAKYISNGTFTVGATTSLEKAVFLIDGSKVNPEKIKSIKSDSVLLFHDTREINELQLVVSTNEVTDTTTIRFNDYQKKRPVDLRQISANNSLAPTDKISFVCTDFIESVDKDLISVFNTDDSTEVSNFSVSFSYNELFFDIDKSDLSSLSITFNENAIRTTHGTNKLRSFDVQLLPLRKFGVINVELDGHSNAIILQLFKNGKLFKEQSIDSTSSKIKFEELMPDTYSFRIIEERIINGKWDVGDLENSIQPEKIFFYSKPIKVRANWEVDVVLEKN